MNIRCVISVLCGLLLLNACDSRDNNVEDELNIDRSRTGFIARFSPGDGVIPFPSNLLFSGSTDATLNIPVDDPNDFSDPPVALNALDGFSTIAPISTKTNLAIDAATLSAATVRMFEVSLSGIAGGVTSVVRELVYGMEFIASISPVDPEGKTLVISPLKPLAAKSHYMLALTTGIQSADGRQLASEATYVITQSTNPLVDDLGVSQVATLTDAQALALEPLRQLVNAQEAALAGQGLSSSNVALSWTFSSQSIGDVLEEAKLNALGTASINPTSIGDTNALLGAGPGLANIYVGSIDIPYYLSNTSSLPTDPLNRFWQGVGGTHLTQFNSTPVATSTETIPLLLSIPKTGAAPWPIVIFMHGITSDRSAMLAIADALASAGFAAIAIDLPLHGLASASALYSGIERTFDLDLIDNNTSAPGPDGIADTSGSHFINLRNLLTTRDNLRQGIADLFTLNAALSTLDYDGGGADIDTGNVYFFGHSLGAMVGSVFLALEPGVKDAVLAMPGGGIAKLLDGSATFGPIIAAGLAAVGVDKGTSSYESFMGAAQTLMDSGDPNNYATAASIGRGVLLFEVIGDQVIPNNVLADAPAGTVPAPLSGTDPLASLLSLVQVSTTTSDTNDMLAFIRFTAGDHRSVLDPSENATVTTVMQTATASFFASDGQQVVISDESVVE